MVLLQVRLLFQFFIFFFPNKKRLPLWQPLSLNGKRSEEHTSELQSRFDLVCRLPLEKKKDPRIALVLDPPPPTHPNHELATKQMHGYRGMLTIEIKPYESTTYKVIEQLQLCHLPTTH